MALDEPREDDEILEDDGLRFLMDRQLFEISKPIRIDFEETETGGAFNISSTIVQNNCSIAENPDKCYASCSL